MLESVPDLFGLCGQPITPDPSSCWDREWRISDGLSLGEPCPPSESAEIARLRRLAYVAVPIANVLQTALEARLLGVRVGDQARLALAAWDEAKKLEKP